MGGQMMKKISVFLMIIITVFSLISCNDNKQNEDELPFSGDLVLYDFEKWESNFQLIRVRGGFGDVDRNDNPDYVSGGRYSAKLRPLGFYSIPSQPYMVLPTYSVLNDYNYKDLRYIEGISMKLFNAEDNDIYVGIGLSFSDDDNIITSPNWHTLASGWNIITLDIDPSVLDLTFNATECYGVYLLFENILSRDIEDAPVLYLDDVTFTIKAEPVEIVNYIELSANEICDFERLYQEYIVSPFSNNPNILPQLSVVKAANYGINATSGVKVLRVLYPGGEVVWGSSPSFSFPQKFMEYTNLRQYGNDDVFCFDIYNNSNTEVKIYPIFYTKGHTYEKWYEIAVPPKKWTTFRKTIEDLNKDVRMYASTSTGKFTIAIPENVNVDREFFYDNFRIEKVSN
jgi:hypothetical protein